MRRLLFIAPALIQGVITLISMPALVHVLGVQIWAEVALGQAVGSLGAIVVFLGWGINGPALVASKRTAKSRALVMQASVVTRLAVLVPSVIVCAVIAAMVSREATGLAILGAVGAVGFGLSNAWFFVGSEQPVLMLLRETLPFSATTAASVVTLLLGVDPVVALVLLIIAPAMAFVSSTSAAVGPARPLRGRLDAAAMIRLLRRQLAPMLVHMSQSGFAQLPLAAVGVLAPGALAGFAAIDRAQKQLLTAAGPIGNVLVADLDRQRRSELVWGSRRQALSNLWRLLAVSTGGLVIVAFTAQLLIELLTVGQIHIDTPEAVLLAFSMALTFAAGVVPALCLAPMRKMRASVLSSVFGLAAGAIALVIAVPTWGAVGALGAIILGAGMTLAVQIIVILRSDR